MATQLYEIGDIVRVDIPDETEVDHDLIHGRIAEVVAVRKDSPPYLTYDDRDEVIYRIQMDTGVEYDLRWRDLRPP